MPYPKGTKITIGHKYAVQMHYRQDAGKEATIISRDFHYRDSPYGIGGKNVAMVNVSVSTPSEDGDELDYYQEWEIHVEDIITDVVPDALNKSYSSALQTIED